ncbi:hypothetical protein N7466_007300 [Penicillium verhagenii]|uniref:uncharacterized protein n=1 Tax=Penicillium verhagenii TaxID=1562060 RepID=UPI002545B156|nr:uncharacterized protein N7466_007300 [Penicillium verhagenii]KAJ5928344.1 hypothetical protein N7466_007300 [Penicillium verhagenii]
MPSETPSPLINEDRREQFSKWLQTASFEKFASGIHSCNDKELGRRVWDLLVEGGIYKEVFLPDSVGNIPKLITKGFEYSAWRTESSSQFKSKAGSGDLIVISGTPRLGSSPVLAPGSISRVSNEDVVYPPMDCIYVSNAQRKD